MGIVNRDDMRRVRGERDFKQNPPELEPGLGGEGWDDIMSSSSESSGNTGGPSIDDILNNNVGTTGMNMSGVSGQVQGMQPHKTAEDYLMDAGSYAAKGFWESCKDFADSLMNFSVEERVKFGRTTILCGVFEGVMSLVLWFIGIFYPVKYGISFFISAIVLGIIGILFLAINLDKLEKQGGKEEDVEVEEDNSQDFGEFEDEEDFNDDDSFIDEPDFGLDSFDFDDISDEDLSNVGSFINSGIVQGDIDNPDIEDKLENMEELAPYQYSRSFLVDKYLEVLPKITPNYEDMVEIEQGSKFDLIESAIQKSAFQSGFNDDEDLLYVESIRENILIMQVHCTRPQGIKVEEVARGLEATLQRNEKGEKTKETEAIYVTTVSLPGKMIFNIHKGEVVMVSVADIIAKNRDFFTDPEVKMPVIWGLNEFGTVQKSDVYRINSLLFSGISRGGKSWKAISYVTQICMFNSPKDVNFIVFDVKNESSDFKPMFECLPHMKQFHSNKNSILKTMDWILNVEVPRRSKILAENGVQNIIDLKKLHPEVELPFLYVVIDEVLTLVSTFSKEEKAEYSAFIGRLVTHTANLGLKLMMFPHRIVDEIIKKTHYTLTDVRLVVKVDQKLVEEACGVGKRDFPYHLNSVGDMALINPDINNGVPIYCHAEVLTKSNADSLKVYKYVGKLWGMLEPDYPVDNNITSKKKTAVKDNSIDMGSREEIVEEQEKEVDESFWDDLLDM